MITIDMAVARKRLHHAAFRAAVEEGRKIVREAAEAERALALPKTAPIQWDELATAHQPPGLFPANETVTA